jgi:uncharacterized protein YbaR (Trm112 family)
MQAMTPEFLALLCCPLCPERPRLALSEPDQTLVCSKISGHLFTISESGLPDLRPVEMHAPAPAATKTNATKIKKK